MSARSIADSTWIKLVERAAIAVLVVGVGFVGTMVLNLAESERIMVRKISEIATVQDKVLVPGLKEVKDSIVVVTDNLLNQPRFDKNDALRMDDDHTKTMQGLDQRLRILEQGNWEP